MHAVGIFQKTIYIRVVGGGDRGGKAESNQVRSSSGGNVVRADEAVWPHSNTTNFSAHVRSGGGNGVSGRELVPSQSGCK